MGHSRPRAPRRLEAEYLIVTAAVLAIRPASPAEPAKTTEAERIAEKVADVHSDRSEEALLGLNPWKERIFASIRMTPSRVFPQPLKPVLLILATDLNNKPVWIQEVNTHLRFPLDLHVAALQLR